MHVCEKSSTFVPQKPNNDTAMNRLIKDAMLLAIGAAAGIAGAKWLKSESGRQTRETLRDLASQAKDKVRNVYEQVTQEMDAAQETAEEPSAPEA